MRNWNKKQKIFFILAILWMVIIFLYSARNAAQSTADSHRIGYWIGSTFIPGFDQWSAWQQYDYAENIDFLVRKTAHACEYMVLAVFMTGALTTAGSTGRAYMRSWIYAVLYAGTDEFHQLFVPGRSGKLTDVCIDAAGALIGMGIVYIISKKGSMKK